MSGETPEKRPKTPLKPPSRPSLRPHYSTPHPTFARFPPLSRPFFRPPLQLPTAPPSRPHSPKIKHRSPHAPPPRPDTKKGESSPHSHPRQQYNSTHFNLSPFNLHPKLNTPVNNLQPKFNPLQPFAHFVFSTLTHTSTPNSLIYTLFLVFTLNTLLYISFSCP